MLSDAKDARKEIKKFHACLNHKDLVPAQFFAMRSLGYPIVSYTSQIIALYESKNFDVIPAFIGRIGRVLEKREVIPVSDHYVEIVCDYLCHMIYYLDQFTEVNKEYWHQIIPEKFLAEAQFKNAPPFDSEEWQFLPK